MVTCLSGKAKFSDINRVGLQYNNICKIRAYYTESKFRSWTFSGGKGMGWNETVQITLLWKKSICVQPFRRWRQPISSLHPSWRLWGLEWAGVRLTCAPLSLGNIFSQSKPVEKLWDVKFSTNFLINSSMFSGLVGPVSPPNSLPYPIPETFSFSYPLFYPW